MAFVNIGAAASASTATSLAVNLPGSLVAGNYLIAPILYRGGTGTTPQTVSGWTLLATVNAATTLGLAVYGRKVTGSESATYNFGISVANNMYCVGIAQYNNVDGTSPIIGTPAGQDNGSTTSCTAPSQDTTGAAGATYVYISAAAGTPSITQALSLTERADSNSSFGSNNVSGSIADEVLAAAGASGTRTGTLAGSQRNIGFSLALRPASADTTPPTLSSTNPANGATGVSTSLASISATFSEAVVASSGHVTVSGGVTGTLSGSGTPTLTLTITSGALAYGTSYTVTLSSSITDAAGNAYAGSTFAFTTESAPPVSGGQPIIGGRGPRLFLGVFDRPGGSLLLDASDRANRAALSTDQHGFKTCRFSYPMSLARAYQLYSASGTPHVVAAIGSDVIWEGRLEDRRLSIGERDCGVELSAFGYWRALTDLRYIAFWSSTSVGDWRKTMPEELATRTPERFVMDQENRLFIGLKKNAVYDKDTIGQWTIETPASSSRQFVALDVSYAMLVPNSTWRMIVFAESRAYAGSTSVSVVNGTGILQNGTLNLTFAGVDRVTILLQYNSATPSTAYTGEDGTAYLKLTGLRVRSVTQATVDSGVIAQHLVGMVNATNSGQLSSSLAGIDLPGIDLRDEIYADASMAQILDRLAALGDTSGNRWEAGVWEGRRLYFRTRGSAGRTWAVGLGELALERSLDQLINGAYGVYDTADRRTLRTPVATDTASIAAWGLTRQTSLAVRTTSATQAERYRDVALADGATPAPRTRVDVRAIRDLHGNRWPLYRARSGDVLSARDLPPTLGPSVDRVRSMRVAETTYQVDDDRLQVTLEEAIPQLSTLIARAGAGLR